MYHLVCCRFGRSFEGLAEAEGSGWPGKEWCFAGGGRMHTCNGLQVVQLNALHEKKDKEYVEKTIQLNSEKENYRHKLDLTQQELDAKTRDKEHREVELMSTMETMKKGYQQSMEISRYGWLHRQAGGPESCGPRIISHLVHIL